MADVYKTLTYDEVNTRTIRALSAQDETETKAIISSFITYFKAKHT